MNKKTPLTSEKIKIDKNVPIPAKHTHWSELPFAEMEVGDSFIVGKKRYRKTSLLQLRSFLYNKARTYLRETCSMERYSFHLDRNYDGVRVFRIE